MDAFTGEIRPFAFGWYPNGWLPCNGTLLPIQQYPALFALLGTYYGGNGTSNFALPNLQGYTLIGTGQSSASGPVYDLGQEAGTETVSLNATEIPNHTHDFFGATGGAALRKSAPTDQTYFLTNFGYSSSQTVTAFSAATGYVTDATGVNTQLNPNTLSPAGTSGPHSNMSPYLAIGYYICFDGYFPPRP